MSEGLVRDGRDAVGGYGGGETTKWKRRVHDGHGGGDDAGGGAGLMGRGTTTATASSSLLTATTVVKASPGGGSGRWDALRGDGRVNGGGGGAGSWRNHHRRRRDDGVGGGRGAGGGGGWAHNHHNRRDDRPRSHPDESQQRPWRSRRRRLPANGQRSYRRGGHEESDDGPRHPVGIANDADSTFRGVTGRLRRRLLDLDDKAIEAGCWNAGCRVGWGRDGAALDAPPQPPAPSPSSWNEAVADAVREYRRIIITPGHDESSSPGEMTVTDGAPPWCAPSTTRVKAGANTRADAGADTRRCNPSPAARGEAIAVLFGCLRRCSSDPQRPIAIGDGFNADTTTTTTSAGADADADVACSGYEDGVIDDACRFASVLLSTDDVERGGCCRVEMGRADVKIAVTYLGTRCHDLVSSLRRIDDDCPHREEESDADADAEAEAEAEAEVANCTRNGAVGGDLLAPGSSSSTARERLLVTGLRVALDCLRCFVVAFSPVGSPEESPSTSGRGGIVVGSGNRLGGGEFVADAVVRSALLPSLEWANDRLTGERVTAAPDDAWSTTETADTRSIATVALRTMTHLLRRDDSDPTGRQASQSQYSYQSAVLAPLVLDVCPTTGAERRVLQNPLKRRSVRAVADSLSLNVSSLTARDCGDIGRATAMDVPGTSLHVGVAASCKALSALVEAAASLRGRGLRRRGGGPPLGRGVVRSGKDDDVGVDVISDLDVPSVTAAIRSVLLLPIGSAKDGVEMDEASDARLAALSLLSSLVRNNPRVAPSHWDQFLLLGGEGRYVGRGYGGGGGGLGCTTGDAATATTAPLLGLIRRDGATGSGDLARGRAKMVKERALAIRVAGEIVRALPLRLWLAVPVPAGSGGTGAGGADASRALRVGGAMGHLGRRVRSSLVDLMGCVRACLMEASSDASDGHDDDHHDDAVVEALCSLSSTLVTRVPFSAEAEDDRRVATDTPSADDHEDALLLRSAVEVLGALGDVFVSTAKPVATIGEGDGVHLRRVRVAAKTAMIGCAGGTIVPGGGDVVSPIPVPTRVWLMGEVDRRTTTFPDSFLRALDELGTGEGEGDGDGDRGGGNVLDAAAAPPLGVVRSDAIDVFAHLARTAPWIVRIVSVRPSSSDYDEDTVVKTRTTTTTTTPRIILTALSDPSTTIRVVGMKLVNSILNGRRDDISAQRASAPATEQLGVPGHHGGGDDHDDDSDDDPYEFVCSDMVERVLLPALRDEDDAVRSGAVEAVGLLTSYDWHRLFHHENCSSSGMSGGEWGGSSCQEDRERGGNAGEKERGIGSCLGLTLFRSVLGMCVRDGDRHGHHAVRSSYPSHGGEEVATVRAAACRSTGSICTEVVGCDDYDDGRVRYSSSSCDCSLNSSDRVAAVVARDTADVMSIACVDANPNVRTMAFFAVGNLSLAMASFRNGGEDELQGRVPDGPPPLLSASTYLLLCRLCCDALNDGNDKVVGNAIRTAGHLMNIWHTEKKKKSISTIIIDSSVSSEIEGDVAKFNESAMRNLTSKVDLALSEAAGSDDSDHLTWKQRSAIKKHAWGACRSLSFLLQQGGISTAKTEKGDDVTCTTTVPATTMMAAVESLIRCVEYATCLNAKITSAAVATMSSIPRDTWRLVSMGEGGQLIGGGIAACVSLLFKRQEDADVSETMLQDVKSLLFVFVTLATVTDYTKVIHNEKSNPGQISYLYQYMIEHSDELSNGDGNCFDVVGEALRRGMTTDVAMLQKFVSRGSKERRRRAIVRDGPQNCSDDNPGADDEDEL